MIKSNQSVAANMMCNNIYNVCIASAKTIFMLHLGKIMVR